MEELIGLYKNTFDVNAWALDKCADSTLSEVRKTQLLILQQATECAMAVIALLAAEEGIRL